MKNDTLWIMMLLVVLTGCAGGAPPPVPLPTGTATVSRASIVIPTNTLVAPTSTTTPSPTATLTTVPTATVAANPTPVLAAELVLVGATVIDGTGAPPLANAIIAIRAGRIVGIGPLGTVPIDPAAQIVDLTGKTVLPGLINAHAHTSTLSDDQMRAFVRAGVTTVRDLGGSLDFLVQRVQRFNESGDASFPRLRFAGPIITVPGGHPIAIYGSSEENLAVRSPEEARAAVEQLLDAGASHIKIAVSGRTDVDWPELSNEQIEAITNAAHARGARVTAHIDRAVALRRAVLSGIDDSAHMPRDRISDELIAFMVERGIALIPTIDVYENLAEERGNGDAWRRSTLLVMQDNLRRFVAAGGKLALGDDYGNPGVALGLPYDEMEKWLGAGLTPIQILVAATQGSAEVCGIADQTGVLATGMLADILVVDGDPLVDLKALQQVALVLREGKIAYRRS